VYSWIWRHLPGPLLVRALQGLVLLAAAVAVLFVVVFPRVEARLPYNDVTVSTPGPPQRASPVPSP